MGMKLVLAIVLTAPIAAHADDFVTLDRQSPVSSAGIEMGYLFPHGDQGSDTPTVLRFDAHGQYVDPHLGLGGYVTAPYTHESDNGASSGGLGDVEVGGIFAPRMADPRYGIVFHVGLALPSGATGTDSVANSFASVMRVQDIYLAAPSGTTLRVGMSPIIRTGNVFARFDFGYDHVLSVDGGTVGTHDLVHLDAGLGVDLAGVEIMGEIVNAAVVKGGGGVTGDFIDTGAVSVRLKGGPVHPYAALQVPLDDDAHNVESAALIVGVDALLR